jgi:DNA-binding CsgD family transcriptional regulator
MNRANQGLIPRDAILDRVLAGHTPRELASQFGVTEWTIRRWLAHAQRRRNLPYWQQLGGMPSGSPSVHHNGV